MKDYFNRGKIFDDDFLKGFGKKVNAPLIDRTKILDNSIEIVEQIPMNSKGVMGFGKICDKRAEVILNRCKREGKELRISYSGGIDSTAAVVAIMKASKKIEGSVDIVIVMSKESEREYPKFYKQHIKGKLEVRMVTGTGLAEELGKDTGKPYIILTGELGDQLFGSMLMFTKHNKNRLGEDWTKTMSENAVKYLMPLVKQNPQYKKGDHSLGNVLWWINFTLKYQWVQLRMYVMLDKADAHTKFKDIVHFFGGQLFQKWALTKPMSVKFPEYDNEKSYKRPAKKYIHEFTGDKLYYDNKGKSPSLKGNLEDGISKHLDRITADMTIIKLEGDDNGID